MLKRIFEEASAPDRPQADSPLLAVVALEHRLEDRLARCREEASWAHKKAQEAVQRQLELAERESKAAAETWYRSEIEKVSQETKLMKQEAASTTLEQYESLKSRINEIAARLVKQVVPEINPEGFQDAIGHAKSTNDRSYL